MNEIISNKDLEQVTGGAEETNWIYVVNWNDYAYIDAEKLENYSVEEKNFRSNDPMARIAVRRVRRGGDMSAGEGGIIHVFVSTFMGYFEKYGGKVNGRTLRF